jgi:hypothetical protein
MDFSADFIVACLKYIIEYFDILYLTIKQHVEKVAHPELEILKLIIYYILIMG